MESARTTKNVILSDIMRKSLKPSHSFREGFCYVAKSVILKKYVEFKNSFNEYYN